MEQQQQELRRAAAHAFMTSLEQLEETFELVEVVYDQQPNLDIGENGARNGNLYSVSMESPSSLNMHVFEDAIADIEQFIQNNS
jgi:hypothetical protein